MGWNHFQVMGCRNHFQVLGSSSSIIAFVIITERGFPSTDKFLSNPTYFYFLPTEWVFFFRVFVISKFKIICYIRIESSVVVLERVDKDYVEWYKNFLEREREKNTLMYTILRFGESENCV